MQVAGVLGPARPTGFSDGALNLEYSGDYEGLRRRGLKITEDIDRVLTSLAGRDIKCDLTPSEHSDSQGPVLRAFGGLSTAETEEIAKDPAVKTLLDSFEGTLLDARRDPGAEPIADDTAEDEEE